jgi:hypothetical protein
MEFSQRTLEALGDVVPKPMQQAFGIEKSRSQGEAENTTEPLNQREPKKGGR